jgi:thiamine-phosphate pyrophosphorylase
VKFQLPPVYPITDKRLAGKSTHLAIVRELVRGGATLIQIRDKETPARELLDDLCRCVEYGAKHGARIIVNDRCDLALFSGAAGAHVGMEDLPPVAARKLLGRKAVIGLSNDLPSQVISSNRLPIQYIGFGPVFATATKLDAAAHVGLAGLRAACRKSVMPVVAIGGIDLERIAEVLKAGAASAAVVSTLMKAKSLARRMEQLLEAGRRIAD